MKNENGVVTKCEPADTRNGAGIGSSLRGEIREGNRLLENEKYPEAEAVFERIINIHKCSDYDIVCSYVLSSYKKDISVQNLEESLKKLENHFDLENTTCEDALGIAASINLKLYNLTQDPKRLYQAIEHYRKGSNYESGNMYCKKNYCSTLLKIYLVEDCIETIKEYYYTAVHNAKIFLSHANTLDRAADQYDNAWFLSNQSDLSMISTGAINPPVNIKFATTRQETTVKDGRDDLIRDLQNMREKIGLA